MVETRAKPNGISLSLAKLYGKGRKEGMLEAAAILEREADRIMKRADKAHDDDEDPDHYDRYEALECDAALISTLAARLRRAAGRPTKRRPPDESRGEG